MGESERHFYEERSRLAKNTFRRLVTAYNQAGQKEQKGITQILREPINTAAAYSVKTSELEPTGYKNLSWLCAELYLHLLAIHRPADSPDWHILYEIAHVLHQEGILSSHELERYEPKFFNISDTPLGKRMQRYFRVRDRSAMLAAHKKDWNNHCIHGHPGGKSLPELPKIKHLRSKRKSKK